MRTVWLVVVLAACGGGRGDGEAVYVETTLEECGVDDTLLAMLACGQITTQTQGCVGVGEACDRFLDWHVNDSDCFESIGESINDAVATCEVLAPVALEVRTCEGGTPLWPADPEAYDCPCEMPYPHTDEDMDAFNRCVAAH